MVVSLIGYERKLHTKINLRNAILDFSFKNIALFGQLATAPRTKISVKSIVHKILISITVAYLALSATLATPISKKDSYYNTLFENKYPIFPEIQYGTGPRAQLLKRGLYLTVLGDCISCHTQPGEAPFAGGYPIKTPFGTVYSPNITPDKNTGIGNWTEKQFLKAMSDGISPNGHYYYPAFPYIYFNKVTKEDLIAIKAYLDTIPPVALVNRKNELRFPFNWRFLQIGWRLLFFHDRGPFKPNLKESSQWNRGAYLVEGLGHCGLCHTPMHYFIFKDWVTGAPVQKYYLTGAFVQGFYAPNITRRNLKDVTFNDLENVFLGGRLIGGGYVEGPMAEAIHFSLSHLTLADIESIGIYLKSIKSQEPPIPKIGSDAKIGKRVFNQSCAGCHKTGVAGAPIIGNRAQWEDRLKKGLNELYSNVLNGIGGMPPKGTCISCSTQEIEDAVKYIVVQSKPGMGHILGYPKEGVLAQRKSLTLNDGMQIYNQSCATCHNTGINGAPKLGDKKAWAPLIKVGMPKLFKYTFNGHNNMPARGNCPRCTDAQLEAAVVYMVQMSKIKGNYILWLRKSGITSTSQPQPSLLTKNDLLQKGKMVYNFNCAICHMSDGSGNPPRFPALIGNSVTVGPVSEHIKIVLDGIPGTFMQPYKNQLTVEQIAEVITYERNSWGNNNQFKYGRYAGGLVQPKDVIEILKKGIPQGKSVNQ
jgi:cytochrome c5